MCASRDAVTVGSTYRVIGFRNYSAGQRPHITSVSVTKIEHDKYGVLNAFVDRKLVGGDSGSPVINGRNELVGIVLRGTHSLATSDDWTGYVFLPIAEIQRFIKELRITA
jgi:V8-like Glu-specific endopeptidase